MTDSQIEPRYHFGACGTCVFLGIIEEWDIWWCDNFLNFILNKKHRSISNINDIEKCINNKEIFKRLTQLSNCFFQEVLHKHSYIPIQFDDTNWKNINCYLFTIRSK